MKIGIMQPYFLSYLGYYSLIRQVDRYLVFDTAQYIYHGWINRNRILKPGGSGLAVYPSAGEEARADGCYQGCLD